MAQKLYAHGEWVRQAYVRWLEAGGDDVWAWLVGRNHRSGSRQYPISPRERTRILAVRRALIDAVSERELQP